MTIHAFTARTLEGPELSLAAFRGQVCLIVNVASECGFTPQYEGLEALYRRYRERGFAVLGFPCDQFGHQEPGDAAAIRAFCTARFGVTFPLFAKIEVNGPGAHPLYRHLTRERRGLLGTRRIKWNFTKFLADRAGRVRARFGPRRAPAELERSVLELLNAGAPAP